MSKTFACVNCLNDACCEVKFDKKGRPYSTCQMCMTRTFYRGAMSLRGLKFIARDLVKLWQNPAQGERQLRAADAVGDILQPDKVEVG